MAPDIVKLVPATLGSIIKSNVVTTTTVCLKSDRCKETIRTREIREKVAGRQTPQFQAALAMVAGENSQPSSLPTLSGAQLSNIQLSGRTLALDAAKNGNVWHLELTHDAVAKGKISAIRLSLNGKMLVSSNAKWKDVSGAWYREHSDMTVYSGGRVAIHTENAFTPTAVLSPDPSDKSAASLTLRAVYAPDEDPGDGTACPEMMVDICTFMQSSNPLPALEAVWNGLGNVGLAIANYFNMLWAGEGGDAAIQLAETVSAYLDAYVEPSLYTIATAISASASGAITDKILEDIGVEIAEWLEEYGILFFLP